MFRTEIKAEGGVRVPPPRRENVRSCTSRRVIIRWQSHFRLRSIIRSDETGGLAPDENAFTRVNNKIDVTRVYKTLIAFINVDDGDRVDYPAIRKKKKIEPSRDTRQMLKMHQIHFSFGNNVENRW